MPTAIKAITNLSSDTPQARMQQVNAYVTHEECTDEEVIFQLGFKPHESEYFGADSGYSLAFF
jgi:hypothetical protein